MGLFDAFKKKECSICGGEIGLLGNRKLEDGNMCKNCAAKLSPWFSERRSSTVEEIKTQLDYGIVNTICPVPHTDDYLWCCHHYGPNSDDYIDSGKGRNVYAGAGIRPSWRHVLWFFACRDGYIWTVGR